MENATSRPKRRSTRRIALRSLGVIGMVSIGLLGRWWTAAIQTPLVTIPNPVLPNPNAFDFYVAAGNAVTFEDKMKPEVSYSLAQKEAWVRQDAGAIDTLHQGFEYPYLHPPCRTFNRVFPYYAGFRKLARLLALRGQVQAAKGDWQGASESYLDAIRMGEDIPHGAPLIGAFVGIACQYIGRKPMWETVEHLNIAQSRAAIDRMTGILERHLPFADTIQEEKWLGQAERLAIFRDAKYRTAFLMPSDMENDPIYSVVQATSGLMYLSGVQ